MALDSKKKGTQINDNPEPGSTEGAVVWKARQVTQKCQQLQCAFNQAQLAPGDHEQLKKEETRDSSCCKHPRFHANLLGALFIIVRSHEEPYPAPLGSANILLWQVTVCPSL